MKRLLSLLMTVALMFSVVCFAGIESIGEADGFEYRISDGVAIIKKYNGKAKEVTVPAELEGYPVVSVGASAFSENTTLERVVLPEGVHTVGDTAFFGCTSLKTVTLPSTLKKVTTYAFGGCNSLTEVHIADIGAWCAIDFGNAFANPLNNGADLYLGDEAVTNLSVPEGTEKIGNFAFYGYKKLESAVIPRGVKRVGYFAFYGCTALNKINLPESVTEIGSNIIDDTAYFSDSGNWQNGLLYLDACLVGAQKDITVAEIKAGTRAVAARVFSGCNAMVSVNIPKGVELIGEGTFSGCTAVTEIVLPDGVKSIGKEAFKDCAALSAVTLPPGIVSIGENAFMGTALYNNAENREGGLLYVGSYLIDGQNVEHANVKAGTVLIANRAFYQRYKLTGVTLPGSLKYIGKDAFTSCNLKSVTVPNGVTHIESGAFSQNLSLAEISLPDSIVYMGEFVFSNTAYDKNSWQGTELYLGNHLLRVRAVWEGIAVYCVQVKEGTKTIADRALEGCELLQLVMIPDSVVFIGENAFADVPNDVVIVGGAGSYAQKYAKEHGMLFAETDTAFENITLKHLPLTLTFCKGDKFTADGGMITMGAQENELYVLTYTDMASGYDMSKVGEQTVTLTFLGKEFTYKINVVEKTNVTATFGDVKAGAWYESAVDYAVNHGLFNGVSALSFAPDADMSRAMLVTVLYRMSGLPSVAGLSNPFNDVKEGQWYTAPIKWAADNDIVGGVGGGAFAPDDNVTREQLATILYRYSNSRGFDVEVRGKIDGFADSAKVHSWAYEAYSWANAMGLIKGNNVGGNVLLDPQGKATRAQVATILMRYIG